MVRELPRNNEATTVYVAKLRSQYKPEELAERLGEITQALAWEQGREWPLDDKLILQARLFLLPEGHKEKGEWDGMYIYPGSSAEDQAWQLIAVVLQAHCEASAMKARARQAYLASVRGTIFAYWDWSHAR